MLFIVCITPHCIRDAYSPLHNHLNHTSRPWVCGGSRLSRMLGPKIEGLRTAISWISVDFVWHVQVSTAESMVSWPSFRLFSVEIMQNLLDVWQIYPRENFYACMLSVYSLIWATVPVECGKLVWYTAQSGVNFCLIRPYLYAFYRAQPDAVVVRTARKIRFSHA